MIKAQNVVSEIILSIIVPMYNSENTILDLLKTLDFSRSIEYEVIIVDDGSQDQSFNIVSEYCLMKEHYSVIKKNNEGAPKARNKGLSLAKGKYIYFCDADDQLNNTDILIKMIELAEMEKDDVIICDHMAVNNCGEIIKHRALSNKMNILQKQKYFLCDPIPGTKLYRHSFLKKQNIFFDNVKIGQDLNFYLKCICNTDRIGYVHGYLYLYHNEMSGISKVYKKENIIQIKKSIDYVEEYCKENKIYDLKLEKSIFYVRLSNYVWQLKKKKQLKAEDYKALKKIFLEDLKKRYKFDLKWLYVCMPTVIEYLGIKYFDYIIRAV